MSQRAVPTRLEKWKITSISQIQLEGRLVKTLAMVGWLAHLTEKLKVAKKNASALASFFEDDPTIDAIKKEIEIIENELREFSKKRQNLTVKYLS